MNQAAFPDRVREFFTLREAEREARALPEETRAATTHALSLAFQKREAAETLWPRGCAAEALRLAKQGLDAASSALQSLEASAETKPAWLTRAKEIVEDARKRTEEARPPELERDVRPSDEETFRVMVDASLQIERAMGLGLAAPREIASTRRARKATGVSLVIVVGAVLFWWFHSPLVLHATASAQYTQSYPAENAIDGDPKTIWLLPDRQSGTLDIALSKARQVNELKIVSGNPPYNDRVAKDARIEAYLADKLVRTADVTFAEPTGPDPLWTDVPLGAKCDRLRLTVKSYYKNGGGIAEVQLK